jgi:hypothetical protein
MAHYMLNRYPDRFTCLAVRQSNFSDSILDHAMATRSIYHPVFIMNAQNDFKICKEESKRAVEWYNGHGYRNVAWIYIRNLGHERTPDLAADFFGRVAGVQPNRPPAVLARQAIDGNADGMAILSGKVKTFAAPPESSDSSLVSNGESGFEPGLSYASQQPVRALPDRSASQQSLGGNSARARTDRAISIRATPRTGIEPLYLHYSAECPADWQRTADFLWTLNGKPIGGGLNGQKTLTEPGDHTLGLLVVTARGEEHRAYQTVRVIPKLSASAAGN